MNFISWPMTTWGEIVYYKGNHKYINTWRKKRSGEGHGCLPVPKFMPYYTFKWFISYEHRG